VDLKKFKEKLQRFKLFLDVVKGKEDIRQKLSFLFQPSNIKTASRLNISQVQFVTDAYTLAEFYPEFIPLRELADNLMESMISHKGLGREEAIKFQQASREQPSTPFGIFQQLTGKDGKKKKEEGKE
jgi:hypothetical protein